MRASQSLGATSTSTFSGTRINYDKGLYNPETNALSAAGRLAMGYGSEPPRGLSLADGPAIGGSTSYSNYTSSGGLYGINSLAATRPSASLGAPMNSMLGSSSTTSTSHPSSSAFAHSNASSASDSDLYRLSEVDALRFRAVLEEGRERLYLIEKLLTDSSKRRETAEIAGLEIGKRNDVAALMKARKELEARFEYLMGKRRELRGLSNKTWYEENEREIQEVSRQLQQSSSTLSTLLKEKPSTAGYHGKLQQDLRELSQAFTITIEDLKQGSYSQLTNLVRVRLAEQKQLEESRKELDELNSVISRMTSEMATSKDQYEREMEQKEALLTRLTQRLKHRRKVTVSQHEYEAEAAEAELEALKRVESNKVTELKKEIDKVEDDWQVDTIVSKLNQEFLAKQSKVMDEVYARWEKKMEEDVGSRDAMLKEVNELRAKQREKLAKLMARWEVEQEEKLQRLESIKKRTIEAELRREMEEKMHRAQRLIRHWWFVYKRKLAKKKKPKKSKKNKEGDKDKGKDGTK